MKMRNSESGKVTNSIIVLVIVVIVAMVAAAKIVPIFLAENAISAAIDDLNPEIAGMKSRQEMVDEIVRIGEEHQVALIPQQIEVLFGPEPNTLKITVAYGAEADLYVKTYTRAVMIEKEFTFSGDAPVEDSDYASAPAEEPAREAPEPAPRPYVNPAGPYPGRAREAGNKMSQTPNIPE